MLRLFSFSAVLLLTGCSLTAPGSWFAPPQASAPPSPSAEPTLVAGADPSNSGLRVPDYTQAPLGNAAPIHLRRPHNLYSADYVHKDISDYAEQMAMALVDSAQSLNADGRVGVASFVEFDQYLKRTSPLGNQLAESFIRELQAYGLSVVDFKTTGHIQVGSEGDLVFSRDVAELGREQELQYLLAGTLKRNGRGVVVNARIMALPNRVVVASAKGFIPLVAVEATQPAFIPGF